MFQVRSIKNNGGFTLVEVLVAVVIMMVGMFGLLEAITVSVQHDMKNQLRNEGIRVGERYMAKLKGLQFDTSSNPNFTSYPAETVRTRTRGIVKDYVVQRDSQVLAVNDKNEATSRQLTVTVKWGFRNQTTVNQVVTVVSRP